MVPSRDWDTWTWEKRTGRTGLVGEKRCTVKSVIPNLNQKLKKKKKKRKLKRKFHQAFKQEFNALAWTLSIIYLPCWNTLKFPKKARCPQGSSLCDIPALQWWAPLLLLGKGSSSYSAKPREEERATRGAGTGEPKRVSQERGGFQPPLCPAGRALAQHNLGEVAMWKTIKNEEETLI